MFSTQARAKQRRNDNDGAFYAPQKLREYGTTKEVVSRLVDDAGGIQRAAIICARAASQMYAYCEPAVGAQLTLDQARRLAAASKTHILAEDFALIAGGVFMPIVASQDPLLELSAKSAEEHGEMIAALVRALSDNKLTQAERVALLAELDDSLRALVAILAKLVNGGE